MKSSLKNKLPNIKSGLEKIVWPPVTTGISATLAALLYQLEESQYLSPGEISRLQFLQLASLAEHVENYSPFFRDRLQKAGLKLSDIASPQGFRCLPPMTRRDVQKAGPSLFCTAIPAAQVQIREVKTSGSTGEPVVVKKSGSATLLWMAMTLRDHLWHRRDFSGRMSILRANIENIGERPDWGPPVNLLFNTGACQLMPNTIDISQQIRLLRAFDPKCMRIYPSNLAGIMDECQREGQPITGLAHILTIGETLTAELRLRAEAFFKAPIEDIYSSQEMGGMALQCPDSGLYHVMAESTILEILDSQGQQCAEGQVGRVVATDLHNFATPMIRYDIGDYAEMGEQCPCGRGLPVIKRFIGRERNLILKPDGSRHWPTVGFSEFRNIAPINQYQFIQHTVEAIEIRLVAETALSAIQEERLKAVIRKSLGYDYQLDFVYFNQRLPLSTGGKFEEFICRIA